MGNFLGREPVLTATAISAGLGLLLAFGLDFSGEQVAAIMALVYAVLGWLVRGRVEPAT